MKTPLFRLQPVDGRQIHSLLMSRVDYLERIDDPLHVRRTLPFVARAENVKEFVAAVEAMKDSLTRLGAGLIFQSLQPVEGNLLERSLHNWVALIAVALRLVPQVGQSGVAVYQPVDNAKTKDALIFQTDQGKGAGVGYSSDLFVVPRTCSIKNPRGHCTSASCQIRRRG